MPEPGQGGLIDALLAPVPATLMVYGVIVGAFLLRLSGRLPGDERGVLQRLLIDVLFPAFIAHSLLGQDDFDTLGEIGLPPVLGFLIVTGGYVLGLAAAHVLGGRIGLDTSGKRRAFAVTVGMANYGYLPLPLAEQLAAAGYVPEGTKAAMLVHNVGVDIALWSIGVLIISGGLQPGWWRKLLNMPLLTIAVVLSLNLLGVTRDTPGVAQLLPTLGFLGGAAIPVALLMTGAVIAEVWREADLRRGLPVIAAGVGLRLVLLPVIILAIAFSLPSSHDPLRAALAVQASMPAALFTIVLSRIYAADPATAVRVSVSTAMLAIITIPLWLSLALWLIG